MTKMTRYQQIESVAIMAETFTEAAAYLAFDEPVKEKRKQYLRVLRFRLSEAIEKINHIQSDIKDELDEK